MSSLQSDRRGSAKHLCVGSRISAVGCCQPCGLHSARWHRPTESRGSGESHTERTHQGGNISKSSSSSSSFGCEGLKPELRQSKTGPQIQSKRRGDPTGPDH
ncbi:hypothetical protein CRENBAI_012693 [Crenichthys baileyi]|uniref:Uncharacterized protein n=1 Tax=Crenichthys baileyi TaxID=28760 RepID=A0AAV9R851_9TELE